MRQAYRRTTDKASTRVELPLSHKFTINARRIQLTGYSRQTYYELLNKRMTKVSRRYRKSVGYIIRCVLRFDLRTLFQRASWPADCRLHICHGSWFTGCQAGRWWHVPPKKTKPCIRTMFQWKLNFCSVLIALWLSCTHAAIGCSRKSYQACGVFAYACCDIDVILSTAQLELAVSIL